MRKSTSLLVFFLQEMLDITGRASTGRRSPSDSSRSPSPTHIGLIHRLKVSTISSARKLSSSPHLREICEVKREREFENNAFFSQEVEEELVQPPNPGASRVRAANNTHRRTSAGSYGAARMIRPRHAVVNSDVIRR